MQSFKQYLQEVETDSNIQFGMFVETKVKIEYSPYSLEYELKNLIIKVAKKKGYDISSYVSTYYGIDLKFKITKQIQCQAETIQKLRDVISSTVNEFFTTKISPELQVTSTKTELSCFGFPNFKLSINEGNISYWCEEGQSISNLDKVILKCDEFKLNKANMIKGGILSLLKLKMPVNIIGAGPFGSNSPRWYSIVNPYLQGDRNILACQEELIDNGLKDYAEL
jgi:hypothetical protein